MQPETRKLAIVSTAHMTEGDNSILTVIVERKPADDWPEGLLGETQYGWWFSNHINTGNWQAFSLSMELFNTLVALFALGYDRVEFDRDGPVLPELPHFNW